MSIHAKASRKGEISRSSSNKALLGVEGYLLTLPHTMQKQDTESWLILQVPAWRDDKEDADHAEGIQAGTGCMGQRPSGHLASEDTGVQIRSLMIIRSKENTQQRFWRKQTAAARWLAYDKKTYKNTEKEDIFPFSVWWYCKGLKNDGSGDKVI